MLDKNTFLNANCGTVSHSLHHTGKIKESNLNIIQADIDYEIINHKSQNQIKITKHKKVKKS